MQRALPLIPTRRARTLVGATALLIGAAIAAWPSQAQAQVACGAQSDFLVRSDALLAPVRPADCSAVNQSPPDFTWPPQSGSNTYTVTLTFPDAHTESRSTTQNWLAWDAQLPAGKFSWVVKVAGSSNDTGQARTFTIDATAAGFVVPTGDQSLARAKNTARPRSWASDATSPIAAAQAERATGFNTMKTDVDGRLTNAVTPEPTSTSKNSNYDDTVMEQKRTLNAAYAWAVTKDAKYGADAARRLMAQAGWSTTGPISFANNDMGSRTVAWTLALGYDWVSDYLDASQKAAILAAIRTRTNDMYNQYIATNQITTYPYDSHGNLTLTITAAIGTLMAGEIAEADTWVKGSVAMAIVWTSPWGGTDGGFANGDAQGIWDLGSNLLAWYVLKNTVGADISRKEWIRNHGRFLAYFKPPGLKTGVFGDGGEYDLSENYARMTKAYTNFAPSALGRWHASQLTAEDPSRLELLLSPRDAGGAAAFPAETANSAFFPSIGWTAFHSKLDDPARASVYFKSSPYGSYNHSHGDQNSFVINYKGKRLAINSGYYDDYRTAHWTNWYKQTRSKNAITFDGGQGQGFNEKIYSGTVSRFSANAGYDLVAGQADKAYGGALTKAQRSMVYLRASNAVVVYDSLASNTARTWEWNIHALNQMTKLSDARISLANGDAQMCVEMLTSPGVAFSQSNAFTSAPSGSNMPNQWHGTFASTAKSTSAEFVAVMRIGSDCTTPAGTSSITKIDGGWNVVVDGKTVTLVGDNAAVDAPLPAPEPTPTPPPPAPTPPPPTGGTASVSSGMDSSMYTSSAGQAVTFTATFAGNSGTPTGTVHFKAESTSIAGCTAVAIANGKALCTTSSLTAGTYKITGLYSGDATYGTGQAGPITQTVTGAAPPPPGTTTSFTIDSSKYTTTLGENVTFTVLVPNNLASAPTGTVKFTDNGNTMSACSAVSLSGNVATCTTNTLTKGTHKIRGVYSGNGTYSAGIAGPITQTVSKG